MDMSYLITFIVYTAVCILFGVVGLKVIQLIRQRKPKEKQSHE